MYLKDGIVYASENDHEMEIARAEVFPYGMLLVTFSNGEKHFFDTTRLTGSAFAPLRSEEVQKTIRVVHGYLSWMDGKIDCALNSSIKTAMNMKKSLSEILHKDNAA